MWKRHISLFLLLLWGVISGCGSAASQEKQTVKVPVRDGIQLTTDLWFPAGEGPWPVILIRTPYGKHNQAGYGKFFSGHDYVTAIQEVRGTGSSEGQFDYWLKGEENGILEKPLVEVFSVGPNRWVTGQSYPIPETDTLTLYFAKDSSEEKGALERSSPAGNIEYSSYSYDPGDPTPSIWFNNYPEWEKIIASRDDFLVFESSPVDNEISILGPVEVILYASSSARDTDWFVYYFLIDDKETAFPIVARGLLRARYRDQELGVRLLMKDKIYPFQLDLWHSSFTLDPGWKIRVVVCSAASPDFARNLNTGGNNEMETEYIKADQKIYHNREHPSKIMFHIAEKSLKETP